MPALGVKAFPIIIPSNIAIITVEIGLFVVPNISIPITLLIPWENKQNTKFPFHLFFNDIDSIFKILRLGVFWAGKNIRQATTTITWKALMDFR